MSLRKLILVSIIILTASQAQAATTKWPSNWPFLRIKSSSGLRAPLIIEPGLLTDSSEDGAIEFDGNDLYITKSGQKVVIGAQGERGPKGDQGEPGERGPIGPMGVSGPAGASGSFAGGDATITGTLSFSGTGNLLRPTINTAFNLAPQTSPPASASAGDIYHDSSRALCMYLGGVWQKVFGTGSCAAGLEAPASLSYSPSTFDLESNTAMTAVTPSFTGDSGTFTVSPSLPAGLTLNSTTGVISGTPTTPTASTTYRITVTNSTGSTYFDITLGVYVEVLNLAGITTSSDVLPRAAGGGAVEIIGSYIYLIGGGSAASPWSGTNSTYIQRASTSTPTVFSNLGSYLPANFAWSDTLQVGSYVYTFGSVYGAGTAIYRASSSDLTSWTTYATLATQSFSAKVVSNSNYVYILDDVVYRASISDLSSWTSLGAIAGVSRARQWFTIGNYVYSVSATDVYRADIDALETWTNISASAPPAEANNGPSIVVGNKAYILGNWNSNKIYSASITNMGVWTEEAQTLPAIAWGMHATTRVGNNVYMYSGLNMSYTGMTSIYVIPVVKSYS